jgi:hypothetical protein
MNLKVSPSTLKAISEAVRAIVVSLDKCPLGSAALVVVILSVGVAVALSHAQIMIA